MTRVGQLRARGVGRAGAGVGVMDPTGDTAWLPVAHGKVAVVALGRVGRRVLWPAGWIVLDCEGDSG